ncbi:hypothetical protein TVAG_184490 [Trichomonas vaginalis G3]|uniref:Uncharacterized protein n=1 Tax=Trichomonas vaginalis (strain ATCC PRA-98 / G3) TaxID=412133 RepID=A2E9Y5_TRIV3|nr:hypothetical protein TVAGG3_0181020 [Trichomonas vaginalis G3]EAY10547.1 hypothetical protein TVAG_184490 [Trichomonas vaginalis G3]KAI5549290.1 hypothetical protein TVAGG3_0181020 [Trichomonas vaginalis G3]|eukprot:XP_001322770.1 hypothetical protein [Trichomonas vaginalis G3]
MGILFSLCKRDSPDALQADPRAALRAGGRIKIEKNVTEDPHAPLLTKTSNSLLEKDTQNLDKDLDALVDELSDSAEIGDDDNDLFDAVAEDDEEQDVKRD